jgi:hypothetical protein
MAKLVKRRRGTTIEHSTFIGAEGEITIDLDKDTVVVHDGNTQAGFPLALEDLSNVDLVNRIGIVELDLQDGLLNQVLQTDGAGTLSFTTVDASTAVVGGDLSGTVGNAQIVANAITSNELLDDAVTSGKIINNAVTSDKIAQDAISTIKILDDAVTTGKIINNAVTSEKIPDNAVINAKLDTNSVTTIKILDANVTAPKLANNAVETDKIADAQVTDVKIVDMAANKLTNLSYLSNNLTDLPYDMAFTGAYDAAMVAIDAIVGTYGELVMSRTGDYIGEAGYIDTAPTGSTLILDILKNNSSIYSTKPIFAIGNNALTPGILNSGSASFQSGDRITFKTTQIGSTDAGRGIRFTLNGKV